VNGMPMGSEVEVAGQVRLICSVQASRMVQEVALFRDGEQVQEQWVGKQQAILRFEDEPGVGEHFYYVEVRLKPLRRVPMGGRCGNLQVAQGDFAWSSPIWVKRRRL